LIFKFLDRNRVGGGRLAAQKPTSSSE